MQHREHLHGNDARGNGDAGGVPGPAAGPRIEPGHPTLDAPPMPSSHRDDDVTAYSTVTELRSPEGIRVLLYGSTHISDSAVEEVQHLITVVRPRVVFLELCRRRQHLLFQSLRPDPPIDITASLVMEELEARGIWGAVNLMLANTMTRFCEQVGSNYRVGAEFIGAYQAAFKHFPSPGRSGQTPPEGHGMIQLGDRDIHVTFQRASRGLSLLDKVKMIVGFMTEDFEGVSFEDIERLKESDILTQMMLDLAEEFPGLLEPLLHERNRYMTYRLRQTCSRLAEFLATEPGKRAAQVWGPGSNTVVAVVGLGHMSGITQQWLEPVDVQDMREIATVPPESLGDRLARYAVVATGVTTCVVTVLGVGYAMYKGTKWVVNVSFPTPPPVKVV
eukprot:m.189275 g.189275  ORF g.189275 m.189275 type:complete len:389 (+) comp17695_c0_seq1:256-1422(+)